MWKGLSFGAWWWFIVLFSYVVTSSVAFSSPTIMTTTRTTTTSSTTRWHGHSLYRYSRTSSRSSSSSSSSLSSNVRNVIDFDSSAARQAGMDPSTTGIRTTTSTSTTKMVDMNQYNLDSLEQIVQEWTVKLVAKSANTDGGVKLFCRNQRDILVDTIQVQFSRNNKNNNNNNTMTTTTTTTNPGMGIMLQEIAGGREDGLGITIVTGLVPGGLAEGADILEGDVISKVALVRRKRITTTTTATTEEQAEGTSSSSSLFGSGGLSDAEEQFEVITECLGYDATVDAIASLPPPSPLHMEKDDMYVVTLKRLRRKPKVRVTLQYPPSQNEPDTTLELFSGEVLRQAMLVRGIKLNDVLAKRFDNKASGGNCGSNGMCTTCAVSIITTTGNHDLLNPMKNSERQLMAANPRWRLSCKTIVGYGMQEGNMTIRVNPRQWDDFVES